MHVNILRTTGLPGKLDAVLSPKSVYHAQFEELGVIDGRRLHPAAWGRMRGVAGRWVNRVGRPNRCSAPSSAGFVYPSAPLSRSQTGCASLPPLPAVLRLEYGVYGPRGLEGDQTVSSHQFEEVSAGRLKSPPIYCKILIAHVKGRSTARISSMTSSQTDSQSGCEGRDGEPGSAFCLECDWTMNSWVFGRIRISLVSKVSLSP